MCVVPHPEIRAAQTIPLAMVVEDFMFMEWCGGSARQSSRSAVRCQVPPPHVAGYNASLPLRAFALRFPRMPDEKPKKLQMARPKAPEQLAKQLAREQRDANREREFGLAQSLGEFRVGSVPYLNAVPLTRGLE